MAVQVPGAGAGRVTITPPGIQSPTVTDPSVTETEPKGDVVDDGAATRATSGPDYDDGDNTPPLTTTRTRNLTTLPTTTPSVK